jgi:hypothetical protein
MMKVKMKISGGFRIQSLDETFVTLRSVLSNRPETGLEPSQDTVNRTSFAHPRFVRMTPARVPPPLLAC